MRFALLIAAALSSADAADTWGRAVVPEDRAIMTSVSTAYCSAFSRLSTRETMVAALKEWKITPDGGFDSPHLIINFHCVKIVTDDKLTGYAVSVQASLSVLVRLPGRPEDDTAVIWGSSTTRVCPVASCSREILQATEDSVTQFLLSLGKPVDAAPIIGERKK